MLAGMAAMCVSCRTPQEAAAVGGYKTCTVSLTDRTLYASYPASIQGRQDVDIYPQVSGLLTQVCIGEGAAVRRGQTLFIIDQVPYRAALERAEADVASAEAAVATARMTAESKEELYRENVVSEFDLQTARNTLQSQQAALAQAQAARTEARNDLSYTEVKSPVDGTAGMIPYRTGALVSPSLSTPLVTVSDNAEMYVYFSMTEKQVLALSREGEVQERMPEVELILSDGSKYGCKGRIDAVSGIIDPKTGAVTIRATFPNPDRILRSGGSGTLLVPCDRKGCIVVPQRATYELQDKMFVYKVVDGKTKSTPITVLGINDGQEYIVESGLTEGDVIVAEGAGLLRDGMEIAPGGTARTDVEP